MRKREFEVLGEELLDVWSLNVVALLEFNNLEDLEIVRYDLADWEINIREETGNEYDV